MIKRVIKNSYQESPKIAWHINKDADHTAGMWRRGGGGGSCARLHSFCLSTELYSWSV